MQSFVKIKPSRNGKITLSFIDIGKSCLSREFFTSLMSFNAIRKNKILAKISESTVVSSLTLPFVTNLEPMLQTISGDKNISILLLSCRVSDLQFSLILQTHVLVL